MRSRKRLLLWILSALLLVTCLALARPQCAGAGCSLGWPLRGPVLRGFEKPTAAFGEGGHQGIDIGAPPGTAVAAAADGAVCWVGEVPRGKFVSISHEGATRTTYLGLGAISVTRGQRVRRGQTIGTLDGTRDPSSSGTHLHFDAYLSGNPVDPRLLMGSFDASSYIRLCPVKRPGGAQTPGRCVEESSRGGLWRTLVNPFKSAVKAIGAGAGYLWRGACDTARWAAGGFDYCWDRMAFPALRKVWRGVAAGVEWCWNNRYVKAMAAGIAAAVVLVTVVIVIVVLAPVSLTVGLIACISTVAACIGTAIYLAATNPEGISFLTCFLKCLSAGAAVAATVISVGSLGAAFSAGWAEMGLAGALKCAAGNGLMSLVFEGSTSYLFTGHVSIKRMLIAFSVGALSGPVCKVVKDGVVGSRLVRALVIGISEGRLSLGTRTAVLFLHKSGNALRVMVTFLRRGATAWGGKGAYLLFTGTFGLSTNVISCMLKHKPITLSGMLSSFFTGIAMGAIGLAFKGKGFDGLFSKVGFLKKGFGRIARKLTSRIVTKGLRKSMDNLIRSKLKGLLKEDGPAYIEEE